MYEPYIYELDFSTIVTEYFIGGLEIILIPAVILFFVSWGLVKAINFFKSLVQS